MTRSSDVWRPDGAPSDPLILDMLEWLAPGPRPYDEVMQAWRTSCPRLTVWEDAVDAGLVARRASDCGTMIVLTPRGEDALRQERGAGRAAPSR